MPSIANLGTRTLLTSVTSLALSAMAVFMVIRLSGADPIVGPTCGSFGYGYDRATGGYGYGYAAACPGPQPNPNPATSTPAPTATATVAPTATGTASATPVPAVTTVPINVGVGGFTLQIGTATLTIPSGALPPGTVITARTISTSEIGQLARNSILARLGLRAQIDAGIVFTFRDAQGNTVVPSQPITMTFTVGAGRALSSSQAQAITEQGVFLLNGDTGAAVPYFNNAATGKIEALISGEGTVALVSVPGYEVQLIPGINLMPWTGANDTPVDFAFGNIISRVSIVWWYDSQAKLWMRNIPGNAALSNFTTLDQFDSVYVVLTGTGNTSVRMIAP